MGIIRVAKNNNYVVMNRTALNDNRLSWKAKGIMAYMLSMPDDWVFYMDELITHATDGKDSFKSGLKELKDNGYVERKPVRDEKTKRIVAWETIVHEAPIQQEENPSVEMPPVEKPLEENPLMENPLMENPQVEKPPLLSIDNNQVLNKPNTDNNQVLTTDKQHAQRLYGFFVSRLQKLPSNKLREDIDYYLSTYQDANLVIEAFERALLNGRVRDKEKYANGTLRNWRYEGVTSMQLLAKKEAQQRASNTGSTSKGTSKVPSIIGRRSSLD